MWGLWMHDTSHCKSRGYHKDMIYHTKDNNYLFQKARRNYFAPSQGSKVGNLKLVRLMTF